MTKHVLDIVKPVVVGAAVAVVGADRESDRVLLTMVVTLFNPRKWYNTDSVAKGQVFSNAETTGSRKVCQETVEYIGVKKRKRQIKRDKECR